MPQGDSILNDLQRRSGIEFYLKKLDKVSVSWFHSRERGTRIASVDART